MFWDSHLAPALIIPLQHYLEQRLIPIFQWLHLTKINSGDFIVLLSTVAAHTNDANPYKLLEFFHVSLFKHFWQKAHCRSHPLIKTYNVSVWRYKANKTWLNGELYSLEYFMNGWGVKCILCPFGDLLKSKAYQVRPSISDGKLQQCQLICSTGKFKYGRLGIDPPCKTHTTNNTLYYSRQSFVNA